MAVPVFSSATVLLSNASNYILTNNIHFTRFTQHMNINSYKDTKLFRLCSVRDKHYSLHIQ